MKMQSNMAQEFLKYKAKAGKHTTLKQNRQTAEKALNDLARELGWED